mgnify:FL=1
MNYFFSIFFGVIGGFVAYKTDIPLPWMLGPLFFIGFLCAIKVEIKLPKKPLPLFRALLGCVIGTNFTDEIFSNINQIGKSLFLLPIFVIIMICCTYFVLKIIMNYDKKTSLIGSMPGGLNEMVLLVSEIGGNERIVTLLNTTRIIMVVTIASILTHLFTEDLINETSEILYFSHLDELHYIFIISIIGFFIGKILSIPGYSIIGPMLLSSFLHAFGFINITPNIILIIVIQIYLGSNLGLYFKDIKLQEFLGPIKAGVLSTFISFILLCLFLYVLNFLGYDLLSLILSYAPGGQAEMCILTLSIGGDIVFVSIHHVFRVFFVIFLATILKKYLLKS